MHALDGAGLIRSGDSVGAGLSVAGPTPIAYTDRGRPTFAASPSCPHHKRRRLMDLNPIARSFRTGPVEIAYLDEGDGDPIVLVHGFASNKEVNWVHPGWVATLKGAGRRDAPSS